jgi:hypothetical protein
MGTGELPVERIFVKKLMMFIALAGLLTGCSWVSSGTGHTAPKGSSTESWRNSGDISTGADVDR